MLDTHCHIDLYRNPAGVVAECEARGIYTIAVTNAPSVFSGTESLTARKRFVRPAVGIHPKLAVQRRGELPIMWQALGRTRYVGEVGLDYTVPKTDQSAQRRVFGEVLRRCHDLGDKILTVHSRRAADDVVSAIGDDFNGKVILHWYSGSMKALRRGVQNGYYFSINPAMVLGRRFSVVLSEIPRDRVLLESDGPFVTISGRPALPQDVAEVINAVAREWSLPVSQVEGVCRGNFQQLLQPHKLVRNSS